MLGGTRDEPVCPVPGPLLEDVAGIGGAAVDERRPEDRGGGVETLGFGVVVRPLLHGWFAVTASGHPDLANRVGDAIVDRLSLGEAKALLGSQLCLKGNLDPVKALLQGTPEEVEEAGRRCIAEVGAGGGFILSPGCEVPRDTPPANLQALVDTATAYGRYQLQ